MWVSPQFVHETLANASNRRMYAENGLVQYAASVRSQDQRFEKLLRSYPELVNYLSKTSVTDQAVAEYDAWFIPYIQPLRITSQRYVNHAIAKSCKCGRWYDESTLNDVYIESVDPSIW